jgi:hypothetical protein
VRKQEAEAHYLTNSDAWDLIVKLTNDRIAELGVAIQDCSDWSEYKQISGEMQGVQFLMHTVEDLASQWVNERE